jgi:hypothetical protein
LENAFIKVPLVGHLDHRFDNAAPKKKKLENHPGFPTPCIAILHKLVKELDINNDFSLREENIRESSVQIYGDPQIKFNKRV